MLELDVCYSSWSHWDRMSLNHFSSSGLGLCICKMGTRSWALWLLLRVLSASVFSGSLCVFSWLFPLRVSTHPCSLSSLPTPYHATAHNVQWGISIGSWDREEEVFLLLPKLGKPVIFSVITSWHLSMSWLVQYPQSSQEIANPGCLSTFLEWCSWLQSFPFLVLLGNKLFDERIFLLFKKMFIYLFILKWLSGKESSCQAGDLGSILGLGKSPGEGNDNPIRYSCLGNPRMEQQGRLQSMGSQ